MVAKTYFTGSPCKRGHVANRYVSSSTCVTCTRERDAFRHANDPKTVACGLRAANVGKRVIAKRTAAALGLELYFTGKACPKGHLSERYVCNGNCVTCNRARSSAYHAQNNIRIIARKSDYYRKNVELFAGLRRTRRARKRGVGGTHTAADVRGIYEAQYGLCFYCEKPTSRAECHVEHFIPLALRVPNTNSRWNIVVACVLCNKQKKAQAPIPFMRSRGMDETKRPCFWNEGTQTW